MLVAQSCLTLQSHWLQPARLLCLWNSPGKNTGVDRHSLLREIFPTQRLNPGLLHCRQTRYLLNRQGSPANSSYRTLYQVVIVVKSLPDNLGDMRDTSLILRSGRSPVGEHGNPLQYSCKENPMDRGPWGQQSIRLQRVGQDCNDSMHKQLRLLKKC